MRRIILAAIVSALAIAGSVQAQDRYPASRVVFSDAEYLQQKFPKNDILI